MNALLEEVARRLAAMKPATVRLRALRRDLAQMLRIDPVFVATDRRAFAEGEARARLADASRDCLAALRSEPSGILQWHRFCLCCNETLPMRVDYRNAHVGADGQRVPNWRERLVCRRCRMNNRQRLAAKLVQQLVAQRPVLRIYLMEQITSMFRWVRRLPAVEVVGSEYLGPALRSGEQVRGIRHEDVTALSFPEAAFDLIVSNDVLEHVPDPYLALQECFRVLAPGGAMLATFPFDVESDHTTPRSTLVAGKVQHVKPPEYHGNPLSADGSLVFTDFGWDLLDAARRMGFNAHCEVYCDDRYGHLGDKLLVFRFDKPATRKDLFSASELACDQASGSSARMSASESVSK